MGEEKQASIEARPAKKEAERKSPLEWASKLGYTIRGAVRIIDGKRRFERYPSWQHAAASTLHGWEQHQYHENEALQLTEEEYCGAILAVSAPGHQKPFQRALSKHATILKTTSPKKG